MKWLRAFAPLAAAVAFAWLLSGRGISCGRPSTLPLVQVLDVTPRDVELADRVAIVGSGFPAGKAARVTFRGVLHRPGESAEEGVELAVWGTAIGAEQVELSFDEATLASFCRAGDRATHTTFRGEVEVAFAGAAAGTPPIAGVLEGVTLDVLAGPTAASVDRDREGERILAFLGVHAIASGTTGSLLRVEGVDPASHAQAAQIAPGDVLTTFDGVRVVSFGDAIPGPGEREATVVVRPAGLTAPVTRRIPLDGLRRAPPTELLGSGLLIVAALALVLLFYAPTPSGLAAAVAHAASRMRARRARASAGSTASRSVLARSFAFVLRDVLPPPGPSLLFDATVYAALAVMPFGQYVVAAKLDVGLLFLAAAAALSGTALVTAGSLWRGVSRALQTAWQHVPAAAAVASVVLMTGSLRVQEIERAQSGWPWDWLVFRSPAALVAFLLLLSAARIELPETSPAGLDPLVDDTAGDDGWSAASNAPMGLAAIRAQGLLVAGLAAVLFLGGWSLPGVSPAQQDAHPSLQLLGCFGLFAKTGSLALVLGWMRWASPSLTLSQRSRFTAIWLVPSALGVLGATAAWMNWGPARPAQVLVSASLVSVVALMLMAAGHRLRHGLASAGHEARLSPFL